MFPSSKYLTVLENKERQKITDQLILMVVVLCHDIDIEEIVIWKES